MDESQKTEEYIELIQVEKCPPATRIYDYLLGKSAFITTRKGIKKALSRNQVYLNDRIAKSGDYVTKGEAIKIFQRTVSVPEIEDSSLEVVFEDDELAIVVKPAGIPVSGHTLYTLQNILPKHLKTSNAEDSLAVPLPIHRLDLPTYGLVVVAKTYSTRVRLGEMLEKREIKKGYQAIVQGRLEGRGTLTTPVDGKEAITEFYAIKNYPSVKDGWTTQVQLNLITGRKHQIRLHLSRLGFPIVGDKMYGEQGNVLKHKGLFLAATEVRFVHPKTKEEVNIKIELPNKFQRFIDREKRWYERIDK